MLTSCIDETAPALITPGLDAPFEHSPHLGCSRHGHPSIGRCYPSVTTGGLELVAVVNLDKVGFVPEDVQLEIDVCPPVLCPLRWKANVDLYAPIVRVVNPPGGKPPPRLDERHNIDRQGAVVIGRDPCRADWGEQPDAMAVFVQGVELERGDSGGTLDLVKPHGSIEPIGEFSPTLDALEWRELAADRFM